VARAMRDTPIPGHFPLIFAALKLLKIKWWVEVIAKQRMSWSWA